MKTKTKVEIKLEVYIEHEGELIDPAGGLTIEVSSPTPAVKVASWKETILSSKDVENFYH